MAVGDLISLSQICNTSQYFEHECDFSMGPYQLLVLLSLFRLWYLHRPQSTGHQKKVGLGILKEMILLVF